MNILRILLTPGCWIRIHPTNKKLSKFINDRLDAGELPTMVDRYTVKLGGKQIWAENYPYGYGCLWPSTVLGIPDRTTVFRLYDAVNEAEFQPAQD